MSYQKKIEKIFIIKYLLIPYDWEQQNMAENQQMNIDIEIVWRDNFDILHHKNVGAKKWIYICRSFHFIID